MSSDSGPGSASAVRLLVRGDVQGVGYRAYAQQQARELGLVGWIRNEADGTVSAHVEGGKQAVDQFVAWTRQGPPGAVVETVDEREAEPHGPSSFEVRD